MSGNQHGQDGLLSLQFRRRGARTEVGRQETRAPLKVLRPFWLDDGRAVLQIIGVGPGVLAGDHYTLNVHMEEGARVILLNQAATKIHSMPDGGSASLQASFSLEDGAELEYYPGLNIPYPDAEFEQHLKVSLAKTSRFATLERWSCGRAGEHKQYRRMRSWLKVQRVNRPLYADLTELVGRDLQPEGDDLAVLERRRQLASGMSWWPGDSMALPESMLRPPDLSQPDVVTAGAFGPHGRYLRGFGMNGVTLNGLLSETLKTWRDHVGLARCDFDRFVR